MTSFLIDECLSPKLVRAARLRGYMAFHIVHIGRASTGDWAIAQMALETNAVLVTNNAKDFLDLYGRIDIHPGLLLILPNVARAAQVALFDRAVDFVERLGDTVNRVVEVAADGTISVREWPKSKVKG